jgi:hypothetical protein
LKYHLQSVISVNNPQLRLAATVGSNGKKIDTNMSLELETLVIEKFIVKTKRDRYLAFIKSDKTRNKFIMELAHFRDLRQERFVEIKGDERKIIKDKIKSLGNINDCYLISENSELDRKRFDIDTALNGIIGNGMGTLIVFGNAEIVFYEGEGPCDRWISLPIKSY